MEALQGGREGLVFRSKDKIYRPSGFWSDSVHKLLLHLKHEGFNGAPTSFGFDANGNEILSYVAGDVYNYPLIDNIASNQALSSASKLLRQYHDATVSFIASSSFKNTTWMLPSREPNEVICHGDFAPYNVALKDKQTVGIFDFDTAHPAPRIWDVAYAIYCWAPFKTNEYDSLGNLNDQVTRAKLFCDAYGLSEIERKILVKTIIDRVQTLVDYMQSEADNGNQAFIENIRDGHHFAYLTDIEYLKEHQQSITHGLFINNDI